jgi:hypothetical protein
MDVAEKGWGDVHQISLAQDRYGWIALVNAIMNVRAPYNAGKLLSGYATGGLKSSAQLHRVRVFMTFQHFAVHWSRCNEILECQTWKKKMLMILNVCLDNTID